MSFSLYGALPPSKSDKAATDGTRKEASSNQLGGLYSSLPAPESGSTTTFKSNPAAAETGSKPTTATTTTTTTTTNTTAADAQPPKPAGS